MIDQISIPLGSKSLDIQIGKLAKQADGAAVVRFGETVVLATAVFSKEPKENAEFFPLTVDYREPTYAAGRIPGGWFKREGRPTEKEILTSRLIDRPMRPLFPKGFNHETQIVAFVLSADGQNDADILAINGASVALTCSAVPFHTPVGAVRVGRLDGKFVLNPTNAERDKSDLDLIVCGTDDAVVMVEGGAREISEQTLIDAILFGHEAVRQIVGAQVTLQRRGGFQKPSWQAPEAYPASVFSEVRTAWEAPMMAAMTLPNKIASYTEIKAVKKAAVSMVPEAEAEKRKQVAKAADDLVKVLTRETILGGKRLDGREFSRDSPDHFRGRHPAPHPRLGALHARRDAGPRDGDPRHRPTTHRSSRSTRARASTRSFCTTTSRPSRSARPSSCAGRRAATSATATSRAGRCLPCSPPRTRSRTPSASCRTSSSPMAPRRWPRSAAGRSPSWMRACRSRRRSRAWRWASSPTASASRS